MLFNSIEFALFLPIAFLLYWLVFDRNLRLQNFFLLVIGYIFYGWWDWRFLGLIFFSSTLDYTVGLALSKQENPVRRKLLFLASIVVNIGFLGFFKYYNFFVDSFVNAFTFFGQPIQGSTLRVILPVGISFYTFQSLAYTISVYKKQIEPATDPISFFAYVSFFPQLVAGPIEKPKNLLPQFYKKRALEYYEAVDAIRQMLWGFFGKIVIADNCSIYANDIFNNYQEKSGSTLLLGALFFTFQIYGDFSGYSNIALGTARLFGFTLMRNFAFPYFSRDIAEFWRRWHISLSSWFRNYVYIPLGGSEGGTWMKIRNIFIIFLLSGFWHGANWVFIIWGLINAIYFLPLMLLKQNKQNTNVVAEGKLFPSIKEAFQMVFTFFLVVVAWVFFRAPNVYQAFDYLKKMFSSTLLTKPEITDTNMILTMISIIIFVFIEWLQREKQHALQLDRSLIRYRAVRWAGYFCIALFIFVFGNFSKTEFIYFAF
ncbi:MAG TPA: MBOAT family O-acyltransferase [Cyclobacteriaceae bacterium]|jgi:D-alanyl-lipoteichoic acid acyltransferase DltB (MBOAT superfamily)|nr:MBOAT family O-acyltransferase [Cyclobacteriaceae bacterium]